MTAPEQDVIEFFDPVDDLGLSEIFEIADAAGLDLDGFRQAFAAHTFSMLDAGELMHAGRNNLFFNHPYALEGIYYSLLADHDGALAGKQGNCSEAMAELHEVIRHLAKYDDHPSHVGTRAQALIDHSINLTKQSLAAHEWRQASAAIRLLVLADMAWAPDDKVSKPPLDGRLVDLLADLHRNNGLQHELRVEIASHILSTEDTRHLRQLREIGIDLEKPTIGVGVAPLYQALGDYEGLPCAWQSLPFTASDGEGSSNQSPLASVIYHGAWCEDEGDAKAPVIGKVEILLRNAFRPASPDGKAGDALRAAIDRNKVEVALMLLKAGANPELVGAPRASLDEVMTHIDAATKHVFVIENFSAAKIVDLNRFEIAEVAPFCTNAKRLAAVMRTHLHAAELPSLLTGKMATKAMDLIVASDAGAAAP